MSDSLAALRRQITGADDLHAVVRTMKAVAASSIGEYERSVVALADYDRMVSLGLGECFRQAQVDPTVPPERRVSAKASDPIGAIVFGSDQGLIGPFNDVIADHAASTLATLPGRAQVWAVGERVESRLKDLRLDVRGVYDVPASVEAIALLVAQIQIDSETRLAKSGPNQLGQIHVFHNRPLAASLYEPVVQRVLPLDAAWQQSLEAEPWPGKVLPEVMDHGATTLRALIREYLFITLFRACAESLASENASRLAAMERADRNILRLLEDLQGSFHRQRQGAIDEELFDVTSGYEALARPTPGNSRARTC
ncbi:F0F1 ATP synthase subunit gamma [Rhodoferax antarcticus]|uniref:Alternate ATP synthase F1, gamma subunit n=1 Tax=Rhodoferax antarcticus ANT.BR TaxID=1111071 RepID=A0A1Q8YF07_9BURK|nr:F0F1 ATP synthase subunit gamma [Rhodoferax antarcticus]APW46248.1 F0F1 ATP synthase subunit gamma [Rhodoferax antarcticus]MCW2313058.1 F-type H+-transporting ATPase subunit gamma [Rhodoferax antarcticus]OLP06450.1 alternate ATP synthase F1, gamma subunit [Rhodoferax antarcticus ANT.BR]